MTPERITELRTATDCSKGQIVHQCWGAGCPSRLPVGQALDGEWDEMLDEIDRLRGKLDAATYGEWAEIWAPDATATALPPKVSIGELAEAVNAAAERIGDDPDVFLIRNSVGNLALLRALPPDDPSGSEVEQIGYFDLLEPGLHIYEDEDT